METTLGRLLPPLLIMIAVGIPAAAASGVVLGQIVRSQGATLAGTELPGAGTLLAGEVLSTNSSGGALITVAGGVQATVWGDTSVMFERQPLAVVAHLVRGRLLGVTKGSTKLAVETGSYRISSDAPGAASFVVAVLDDQSTAVRVQRGSASVTDLRSGSVRQLKAGDQLTMAYAQGQEGSQPAPSKPSGQAPPPAAKKSNTGLIVAIAGGAAAAGIALALAASGGGGPASPSAP